jgi:hypothetical protein
MLEQEFEANIDVSTRKCRDAGFNEGLDVPIDNGCADSQKPS